MTWWVPTCRSWNRSTATRRATKASPAACGGRAATSRAAGGRPRVRRLRHAGALRVDRHTLRVGRLRHGDDLPVDHGLGDDCLRVEGVESDGCGKVETYAAIVAFYELSGHGTVVAYGSHMEPDEADG